MSLSRIRWLIPLWIAAMVASAAWISGLTPWIEQQLVRVLRTEVAERLDARLEFESTHLSFFPPRFWINKLRIVDSEMDPEIVFNVIPEDKEAKERARISVHRAEIRLRPWPSLEGRAVLQSLTLDGFRFQGKNWSLWEELLETQAKEKEKAPKAKPAIANDPLRFFVSDWVDARAIDLQIFGAAIESRLPNVVPKKNALQKEDAPKWIELGLQGLDVSTKIGSDGRQFSVALKQLSLGFLQDTAPWLWEGSVEGHWSGDPYRPDAVHIENGWLNGPGLAWEASGMLPWGKPAATSVSAKAASESARDGLTVRMRASLQQIGSRWPQAQGWHGELDLDGMLAWKEGVPQLGGRVRVDNLASKLGPIGDGYLRGVMDLSGWHIEDFGFDLVDAPKGTGPVRGHAELQWKRPHAFKAEVTLAKLSLADVLARCGILGSWVDFRASGSTALSGTFAPWVLELKPDLTLQQFYVANAPPKSRGAWMILDIDTLAVVGPAHLENGVADLKNVRVVLPQGALEVSGEIGLSLARGFELRVQADTLSLADISPIGALKMRGVGRMGATLEGPLNAPTISGTLEMERLVLADRAIGKTNATLIYDQGTLFFPRIEVREDYGSGRAEGMGSLGFGEKGVPAIFEFDLEKVGLARILQGMGYPKALWEPVGGAVDGRLEVEGLLATPKGRLNLISEQLWYAGSAVGPAELNLGFDVHPEIENMLTASLRMGSLRSANSVLPQMRADLAEGFLGTVTVGQEGAWQAEGKASQWDMAPLEGVLALGPVAGLLSGTFRLAGERGSDVRGEGRAKIKDLALGQIRIGDFALDMLAKDGALSWAGKGGLGRFRVEGALSFKDRHPFHVGGSFRDLALAGIVGLPDQASIKASGSWELQGEGLASEAVHGRLQIDQGNFRFRDLSLTPMRPLKASYKQGRLYVEEWTMRGQGAVLSVAGMWTPKSMDLALNMRGAPTWLASVWPEMVVGFEGDMWVDAKITGNMRTPRFGGDARVSSGVLRLRGWKSTLSDLEIALRFTESDVQILAGNGRMGGGRAQLAGFVGKTAAAGGWLDGFAGVQLGLSLGIDRVTFEPFVGLQSEISGKLNIEGPWSKLAIDGDLAMLSGRYSTDLALVDLIPKGLIQEGIAARSEKEGWPLANLRVHLKTQAPLEVRNNVLQADLAADLVLRGTLQDPGLVGSVSAQWAEARYQGTVFSLEGGHIDFVDEFSVRGRLDIRARAEACGIRIQTWVAGPWDDYQVTLRGDDREGEVEDQDVLACLQFGRRLQDFEGPNAAGLSAAALGSLDALWTVSGLDRKVRELVPLPIDEFRLTSAWSSLANRTTPRVRVGKEVGDKFRLTYSRSLDEYNDQDLRLEYRVAKRATLEGGWMSTDDVPVGDFGLDLRLRWVFQ